MSGKVKNNSNIMSSVEGKRIELEQVEKKKENNGDSGEDDWVLCMER